MNSILKVAAWAILGLLIAWLAMKLFGKDDRITNQLTTAENTLVATTTTEKFRYNPEGTTWKYEGGTIEFKDGRYSADVGCNVMNGSFSVVNKTELKFESPASTRKMCSEDLMKKDADFAALIVQMTNFTETTEGAVLSGNGKTMNLTK